MTVKTYKASTEETAIKMAHEEFGEDALILKIQTKKPRGILQFFKKPIVEVTAAIKENNPEEKGRVGLFNAILEKNNALNALENSDTAEDNLERSAQHLTLNNDEPAYYDNNDELIEQQKKIKELENKINNTENLLSKVTSRLTIAKQQLRDKERRYDNTILQLFYDTLIAQGVAEYIADELLAEACEQVDEDEININLIVKIVYNIIINTLEQAEDPFVKKEAKKDAKLFAFIGPTGVGKTTTIAKLASILILKKSLKLALVTADTYRIAAVEQLRTYADILDIGVDAVYKPEDLTGAIKKNKKVNDVILLDTAGRSHKNEENMQEISALLDKVPNSEKFLVLSLTTKYETLVDIVSAYSEITDFSLIFTKADEAEELGAILNICYLTGKKVAYISTGQNVPEDIELAKPEKIAKSLLGLGGDVF